MSINSFYIRVPEQHVFDLCTYVLGFNLNFLISLLHWNNMFFCTLIWKSLSKQEIPIILLQSLFITSHQRTIMLSTKNIDKNRIEYNREVKICSLPSSNLLEWTTLDVSAHFFYKIPRTGICCWCSAYLIFVIFFTLTYFEAWKFYTQKCVNLRQKLPRDEIA